MILLSFKSLSQAIWNFVSKPNLFVVLEIYERLEYAIKSRLNYSIMQTFREIKILHYLLHKTFKAIYIFPENVKHFE